jgi:hypothetical protein
LVNALAPAATGNVPNDGAKQGITPLPTDHHPTIFKGGEDQIFGIYRFPLFVAVFLHARLS